VAGGALAANPKLAATEHHDIRAGVFCTELDKLTAADVGRGEMGDCPRCHPGKFRAGHECPRKAASSMTVCFANSKA